MMGSGKVTNVLCVMIGAFGEVRVCIHRETGTQRAIKVLKKDNMNDEDKKLLENEIKILRQLVTYNCEIMSKLTLLIGSPKPY